VTAVVVATMMACSEESETCEEEAETAPSPSGATCPAGSTLTYENFGKPFMEKYCTSCHSSTLRGEEARQCAPEGHDFDTEMGILGVASHIDWLAASGPTATNTEMPPSGAKPTAEERTNLGIWLACVRSGGPADGG
jgi:uncharacterized membrane protein